MIPQGDFINLFSSEVFVFVVLRIVVDKKSTVVCTAPSPKRPYIFLFADFFDLSDPKSSFFFGFEREHPFSAPRLDRTPPPVLALRGTVRRCVVLAPVADAPTLGP